jgi:hypothetical protein
MKFRRTESGEYYERDERGLRPAAPGVPDVVICRRVVDYPDGQPPIDAALDTCTECSALVAYNPSGPHLERPRVCMQCAGIQPLPIHP